MTNLIIHALSALLLWLPTANKKTPSARASCKAPGDTSCRVERWDRNKNEGKIHITGKIPRSFDLRVQPADAAPYTVPVAFSSKDSVRDCTATLECPNGDYLECAASGPSTSCSNNATTVGCFVLDENGESVSGSTASCP